MQVIEKIHDINLRVASIIEQQQQLKSQARNWEQLYKEATDVQKKLIEQSTNNAKRNEISNMDNSKLRGEVSSLQQEHHLLTGKYNDTSAESENLKSRLTVLSADLQVLREREEKQMSIQFGVENEYETLKAINEDLKEQLEASQHLNSELQTELQGAKISMVEEHSEANIILQQRNNLSNELNQLKEKYQNQLSELHSKNSQLESQVEKLNAEYNKLKDEITALAGQHSEKDKQILSFKAKEEELRANHLTITLEAKNENIILNSRVEQLTALVNTLESEKEQMRKSMEEAQSAKATHELHSSQGSGSNEEQVNFLYAELQASQSANSALERQLQNYLGIIAELNKNSSDPSELKNLQEQNKIVKLAEAIEGNTVASNLELKQKLNEMIREVDRCIAKLSS